MNLQYEFLDLAHKFLRQQLPMLDRNYLSDTLEPELALLLSNTVSDHTSAESNTVLRNAALTGIACLDEALMRLPPAAQGCRCRDLDNGEHAAQYKCHRCLVRHVIQTLKASLGK
jgi:hypothetical protein